MKSSVEYFGIDGCRGGWFYVGLDRDETYTIGVKELAGDDILDAMVGTVTATDHPNLATLPEKPTRDASCLPMEMVYSTVYMSVDLAR